MSVVTLANISIFSNNLAYVESLLRVENQPGLLCSVSSFLSSTLFPDAALQRFFQTHPGGSEIARLLIERKALAIARQKYQRREIYESSAFTEMIKQGLVHEQERSYRTTPRETIYVLEQTLSRVQSRQLTIAITAEIVPLVFIVAPEGEVLIDIRTNYSYQMIQGIAVSDAEVTNAFHTEFERMWNGPSTLSDQALICDLIASALDQWRSGRTIDVSGWPEMKKTDVPND